jgi:hypothetical protein
MFCGSTTNKLSREHIFHESFGKHIPHSPSTRKTDSVRGKTERDLVMPIGMFQMKLGGVCKLCNESWMHRMDLDAEASILDLALGHRTFMRPNEIEAFSVWATKVALLRAKVNEIDGGDPDAFLLRQFHSDRLPPAHTQIRVGTTPWPYFEGGHNGYCSVGHYTDDDRLEGVSRINMVSWGMGRLFTHVIITSPSPEGAELAAGLGDQVDESADGQLTQIWPTYSRPIELRPALEHSTAISVGYLSDLMWGSEVEATD